MEMLSKSPQYGRIINALLKKKKKGWLIKGLFLILNDLAIP